MADVIVVGVGLAGAAALRKLHEAGLQAVGVEAAGRLGGRVLTVPFASGNVDLGGQWCLGENIIYDLLKDYEPPLLDAPDERGQVFLLSDGTALESNVGASILQQFSSLLASAGRNCTLSIPAYLSAVAKDNAKLSKNPDLIEPFIELYKRSIHSGHQVDNRSKSVRGLAESVPVEGDMFPWKGNGFQNLVDTLLKSYPNPQDRIPVEIKLNKEVECIEWDQKSDGDSDAVRVKCTDGSVLSAKYVIITASVGVLQNRHKDMFNPPLPAEKVQAIDNLQMSVIGKIYIEFSKPWWPDTVMFFFTVWKPEDKAKFSKEEWWQTEIFLFCTVNSQPNVLCAWVVGEGAKTMERQSNEAVQRGIEKVLDTFYGKMYSVPDIVAIKRTQWGQDRLTGGAYAYRCVDTEVRGGSAGALGKPLLDRRSAPVVCFAGEATSPRHHASMHGAVESGFREARRIIDHMETANK